MDRSWQKKNKRIRFSNYPEGYLESLEEKQNAASENGSENKRKNDDSSESKKRRKIAYTLSSEIVHLIQLDIVNKKFAEECLEVVSICNGQQEFLKKVVNTFSYICCQEVVFIPITTICYHNICK
ncbi:hypothetical protein CDAR_572521, partial [Caerostris darwini]